MSKFLGLRCEERNHCQSNKCQNGAICINEATDEEPYRCECPFDQGVPTFYGKYCQFDVDECKRDPCQVNFNPLSLSWVDHSNLFKIDHMIMQMK